MVLKKISTTPVENTSLWIVLARRIVNMKVQRNIILPHEIPSLFQTKKAASVVEDRNMTDSWADSNKNRAVTNIDADNDLLNYQPLPP